MGRFDSRIDKKEKMKRSTNFELLKIICMFFVISLHVCTQSSIASNPASIVDGVLFIVLSEFGRTACTVFVMVSAWFLSEASFKTERLFNTWIKTLVYIIAVYLCYHSYTMPWYDFLPIGGGILWFISAYMCLILVSPILNAVIRKTGRQYLLTVILLLGVPMLFYSTVSLNDGQLGSNVVWFIWIYLLMGYLRKYPVRILDNRILMTAVFLILCAARLLPRIELRYSGRLPVVETWLPYLDWWKSVLWTIPNFLTAFTLFFVFYKLNIKYSRVINFFGAHILAIYTLHQMPFFYEYLWEDIFNCSKYAGSGLEIPYMLLVVLSIIVVASLIDVIFDRLVLRRIVSALDARFKKIDQILNL